jgi:integrase
MLHDVPWGHTSAHNICGPGVAPEEDMRKTLTDRTLSALKPADKGTRYEVRDAIVPGLLCRVTETGKRTFALQARFPGSTQPTRRAIGEYGVVTLDKARQKAREWIVYIAQGIDPAIREEEARQAELRKRANTFASVVEDYLRLQVIGPNPDKPRQRQGHEVAREFRTIFVSIWGERPITGITQGEILALIESVRDNGTAATLAAHGKNAKATSAPAPGQARNLLGYLKTFFAWAIERGTYGLESSPCAFIKGARVIGERQADDRTLSDAELIAFWQAANDTPYPHGPIYKLLLLTGLRLNEVADASWNEFDLDKKIWIIPAHRMKGKNGKARPHSVPLTADILTILASLPRFSRGEYLFSLTGGKSPVWITDRVKKRLDADMLKIMRSHDPDKVLPPWKNHHLRHTLRTRLDELRINGEISEAILSHKKPGIRGVYNHYEYFDEKRHALELWATRLRSLTQPQQNVVELAKARG